MKTRCEWHCRKAFTEATASAAWLRQAEAAEVRGGLGDAERATFLRRIARCADETAEALMAQVPHGYHGPITYMYEPADPNSPNRRMVVTLGRREG